MKKLTCVGLGWGMKEKQSEREKQTSLYMEPVHLENNR